MIIFATLVGLLGCADEPIEQPSGYLGTVDEGSAPSFDATAVEAAINTAMKQAKAVNSVPVFDAYAEITNGAMDENCPDWLVSYDGTFYWYDNCTSSSQTTFSGYAYHDTDANLNMEGIDWHGEVIFGLATITDPAGHTFFAPGRAARYMGSAADGSVAWWSQLDAGFTYDGPSASGTWFEDGASPDLHTIYVRNPSSGDRGILVDGWLASTEPGITAVAFESIQASENGWGTGCTAEPAGAISILGAEGLWFDLVFDGPEYTLSWDDSTSCDGCGEAWFQGAHLGTACIDVTVMTDWGDSPW